jgi:ABC-type multidrug transport system fused ATPase/permease subunit
MNAKPDRPALAMRPRDHEIGHVDFEYREGRPVVHDFNVTVPRGSVVALVGRSGAGKTTVTDLVARFHDPTGGEFSPRRDSHPGRGYQQPQPTDRSGVSGLRCVVIG